MKGVARVRLGGNPAVSPRPYGTVVRVEQKENSMKDTKKFTLDDPCTVKNKLIKSDLINRNGHVQAAPTGGWR